MMKCPGDEYIKGETKIVIKNYPKGLILLWGQVLLDPLALRKLHILVGWCDPVTEIGNAVDKF
ncbi:MAG: hypothetical protein ACREVX_09445 [Clostridium sp.]|uniref:hypothetical protein n=1 Tax=Clostridium sp. TaxID=1506 RepID=UPI003D6D8221